ncbi:transcriptional regulator [Thioclava sp. GXIMD4215]|uniref:helix-turn-helix domain-containing protein n=1 Tax=Thioclava sp. GXIMD4215 TaxID=3131928 RepID=UPI0032434C67
MRTPTKEELDAHELLKAQLRIRGTSLAQLAREIGVNDSALTLVGKRMCRSARIEKALAEAVGRPVEDLFPCHNRRADDDL